MYFAKKMLIFPLFLLLSACADNPTAPTPVPEVKVNPVVTHLKVGESQVFTFSGGNGSFDFSFNPSFNLFTNIERVGEDAIKIIYLRERADGFHVPTSSRLIVRSGNKSAESIVYFDE